MFASFLSRVTSEHLFYVSIRLKCGIILSAYSRIIYERDLVHLLLLHLSFSAVHQSVVKPFEFSCSTQS